MKRLLPYRDYSEHDVVNLFKAPDINTAITDTGDGDEGLFVKVSNGTITNDPVSFAASTAMLGSATAAHLGVNQYPSTTLGLGVASAGDMVLGITLKETAKTDENGESLLWYPQKRRDLNCLVSGETVPVAKKGTFTLSYRAFGTGAVATYVPAPGTALVIGASAGRVTGIDYNDAVSGHYQILGSVLATGLIDGAGDYYTGAYAIVNIDC